MNAAILRLSLERLGRSSAFLYACVIVLTGLNFDPSRPFCSMHFIAGAGVAEPTPSGRIPGSSGDPPQGASGGVKRQSNCSTCYMREEAKLAHIERIKMELLQKLGFEEPPNTTNMNFPPMLPQLKGLLKTWGFRMDEGALGDDPNSSKFASNFYGEDAFQVERTGAQTERVYAIATKPPNFLDLPYNQPISYFKFSNDTIYSDLKKATLRFYVKGLAESEVTEPVSELVARLYKIKGRHGTKVKLMDRTFKRDLRGEGHWDEFSVTDLVRFWFDKQELNYGITLDVFYKGQNLVVTPWSPQADKHMMYMEVMVRDSERTRRKRDAPRLDCQENTPETRCCRYPLHIDFEKFGWDWVIAPKKYVAYYCSGECPFRHLQRYMHTHLLQQANPVRSSNVGPCCYPTQMASMPMVYFNSNKEVLVSKVPGMIVSRCGCA